MTHAQGNKELHIHFDLDLNVMAYEIQCSMF